jgi:anti-sigma28 factor (negative regulator of flagellin synthesis)
MRPSDKYRRLFLYTTAAHAVNGAVVDASGEFQQPFPCASAAAGEDGLPDFGQSVYNDRQNLPQPQRSSSVPSGQPVIPEAPMKPARSQTQAPATVPATRGPASVETRAERLERIKREIAAGTYETPEKLEAAIERMLGVLID